MRFMVMHKVDAKMEAGGPPDPQIIQSMGALVQESLKNGVFITGAGNGPIPSHPRPPILSFFSNHGLLFEDSNLVDNSGMALAGQGTGNYTIRRSLISRDGIGGEMNGNGHTLLVEDTWFTSCGRGPTTPLRFDGDLFHIDGASSVQTQVQVYQGPDARKIMEFTTQSDSSKMPGAAATMAAGAAVSGGVTAGMVAANAAASGVKTYKSDVARMAADSGDQVARYLSEVFEKQGWIRPDQVRKARIIY